jgi:hypothetical protein
MRHLDSTATAARRSHGAPGRQTGVVLVVSLILLVVLTLLGLASMNMSSLEEKMAANSQESIAALQAADSGLTYTLEEPTAIPASLSGQATDTISIGSGGTQFNFITTFRDWTPPPQGSLYSAENFQAAHFNVQATGTTGAGATVVVNGGMYQIAPKGL